MSNVIAQHPAPVSISSTSANKTFAGSCTPGSLLIAVVTTENSDNPTLSVSDPTNGTWTQDLESHQNNVSFKKCAIFSKQNTASSALTVTVALGASSLGFMQIYECAGLASTSALDTTGVHDIPPGGAAPSVTITAAANSLIVAGICQYQATSAPTNDSGYTLDLATTAAFGNYHTIESIADAGGAGSKTLNWGGAGVSVNPSSGTFVVAAYKTAAGGGVKTPIFYNQHIAQAA